LTSIFLIGFREELERILAPQIREAIPDCEVFISTLPNLVMGAQEAKLMELTHIVVATNCNEFVGLDTLRHELEIEGPGIQLLAVNLADEEDVNRIIQTLKGE
jgi:hypothetical protein